MPLTAATPKQILSLFRKHIFSVLGFTLMVSAGALFLYEEGLLSFFSPKQPPAHFVFNTVAQAQSESNAPGSLSFRVGEWGISDGGVVVLSASENPELVLNSTKNVAGSGAFRVYPVSREDLFHYLAYRKDPNTSWGSEIERLYTIDPAQLSSPASVEVTLRSGTDETVISLPISGTGVWFVEGEVAGVRTETMVIRSHLAGMVHEGDNETVFWVQDNNYASVLDAQVELVRMEGGRQVLNTLSTNQDGLAVAGIRREVDLAFITRGDDFTLIPVNLENLNWFSHYDRFDTRQSDTISFLFTDRFLYKPGDTVLFKAVIRNDDDAQYTIVPRTVQVILGGSEDPIWQANMTVDELGTVTGSIPLPEDLSQEYYSLYIRDGEQYLSYKSIQVAQYRKPDVTVHVETDKMAYFPEETITARISGEYFFGQPTAGQEVRWKIYQRPANVSGSYETLQYEGRTEYYGGSEENFLREGTVSLDQNGQAELKLPVKNDTGKRQFWQIQLELLDADSAAAYDEMRVLVQPGDFVIGTNRSGDTPTLVAQQPVRYPFKLYPNKPDVQLSGIQVKGTLWVKKDSEKYVLEQEDITAVTNERGEFELEFTPQQSDASYSLTLLASDRSGRTIKEEVTYYVYSPSSSGRNRQPRFAKVTTDKSTYAPGETATITVTMDSAVKNAFVSLGRSYSRQYRVLPVVNGQAVFQTVIPESYQPNFYVYAGSFFKGGWDSTSTKVAVDTADKNLTIDIRFSKEEYRPGETAEAQLTVTDGLGNPVQTDVAFWLFDKALLELHGVYFKGIFEKFWNDRWFGIKTNHSFQGIRSDMAEGGGGGGGDERSVFKDTAYWNPHVMTGPDGKASVSIELPDNLTTWVAAAVGASTRTQVGDGLTEVTVTKDVIVRPILPNFLRVGDQFVLASMLHNFTPNSESFSVTADFIEGEMDLEPQQVTLSAGKSENLKWPLTISTFIPEANFTVRAQGLGNSALVDQVSLPLPVYEYGLWQKFAHPLSEGDMKRSVKIEGDASRATRQLVLRPFRYPQLQGMLDRLLNRYVDVSTASDHLIAASLLRQYGTRAGLQYSTENLNQKMAEALKSLEEKQNSAGVWSKTLREDPDLNARIVEALVYAQKAGYLVDQNMIDRALASFRDWRPALLSDRILQQYVFSLFPESELERRHIKLEDISYFRHADALRALLANTHQGFADSREAIERFVVTAPFSSSTQLVWSESSENGTYTIARPTILGVRALLPTTNSDFSKVEKALDYLHRNPRMVEREGMSAYLALVTLEYTEKSGQFAPNYEYTVLMNDEIIRQGRIAPATPLAEQIVVDLPKPLPETFTLEVQQVGTGSLFSVLEATEFFADRDLPADGRNHLTLKRQYLSPKKEKSPLKPGDLVIVQFDVTGLGKGETEIQIEDYLPAGLVPVDESLIGGRFDESGINTGCVQRDITPQGMRLTFCSTTNDVTYSYKARVVSQGVYAVPSAVVHLVNDPSIWARTSAETLPIDGKHTLGLLQTDEPSEHRVFGVWLVLGYTVLIMAGVFLYHKREGILQRLRTLRRKPQSVEAESAAGEQIEVDSYADTEPEPKPESEPEPEQTVE